MITRTGVALTTVRDRHLHWLWITLFALWRAGAGDHSEAMWMSREGLDVLAGTPLVHQDSWSWAPQPWDFIPTSPGWQLMSGALRGALGYPGLMLLTGLTVWLSLAGVARVARGWGASSTGTSIAILCVASAASSSMSARAGLPAFVLLLVAIDGLWRLRRRLAATGMVRSTAALLGAAFGTAYVGVWMHGSWATFALVALGAGALQLTSSEFGTTSRRLMLLGALVIGLMAGVASGPLGLGVLADTGRVAEACLGIIAEWSPPLRVGPAWFLLWAIAQAGVMALGVAHWRNRSHDWIARPETTFVALALGATTAGAFVMRFLMLGIIAATPPLAVHLTRTLQAPSESRLGKLLGERLSDDYWRRLLALLALALAPVVVAQAALAPRIADPAIAALPSGCRLFSDDATAKPVEFWRADVRVWLDGRHDYWGRERLLLSDRFLAGASPTPVPPGTTCVLLGSGSGDGLAQRLADDPGWRYVGGSARYRLWLPRTG